MCFSGCSPMIADAYQAIPAARAVICPINTRLAPLEIAYILEHSRAKLILVDYEYAHLINDARIPVILSNDTGRAGDPYEEFLSRGRKLSEEHGWWGLEPEDDEDAGFALCYTLASTLKFHTSIHSNLFNFRQVWDYWKGPYFISHPTESA